MDQGGKWGGQPFNCEGGRMKYGTLMQMGLNRRGEDWLAKDG